MRKIVAGEFISLDGVVEAPNHWHFPYFNDEMGEAVGSDMTSAGALLLGRRTYEEFAAAWPSRPSDEPGADFMNNTPKFVVSTTLDKVEWQNSTLITGNFVEEITRLKEQPGKNIAISGSPTLVRWLLRDGRQVRQCHCRYARPRAPCWRRRRAMTTRRIWFVPS